MELQYLLVTYLETTSNYVHHLPSKPTLEKEFGVSKLIILGTMLNFGTNFCVRELTFCNDTGNKKLLIGLLYTIIEQIIGTVL